LRQGCRSVCPNLDGGRRHGRRRATWRPVPALPCAPFAPLSEVAQVCASYADTTGIVRRLSGPGLAALVVVAGGLLPMTATARSLGRPTPTILTASWGTDGGVACPTGQQGLDNIPIVFTWFIRRSSIQPTDFQVLRSDATVVTPTCALQFPAYAPDEAQTVNLIGDFGDSVTGPTPVAVRVVGALHGKAVGTPRWRPLPRLPQVTVSPLSGGPYIVDAWKITPAIWRGDPDHCTVGKNFVRVVWSNGLTAYPTGAEIGPVVTSSYRVLYTLPNGKITAVAPLAVVFHFHAKVANEDNNDDLCLPRRARDARLTGVTIAGGLMQDPDGNPNVAQNFQVPRSDGPTR
jgi:hypothetical protein